MQTITEIKIGIAQNNWHVGHIEKNLEKIINALQKHKAQNADLVIFSELAICGYTPEDILFRLDFAQQIQFALDTLCTVSSELGISLIIGHPSYDFVNAEVRTEAYGTPKIFNSASLISEGKIVKTYHKMALPNYSVFDEKRYFSAGNELKCFEFKSLKLGILICEDIWDASIVKSLTQQTPDIILSLHGSPYFIDKQTVRETMINKYAKTHQIPIIYVNQIGGQDDLIFDGGSFTSDISGEIVQRLPLFEEADGIVTLSKQPNKPSYSSPILTINAVNISNNSQTVIAQRKSHLSEIYQALMLATRDYVQKNGFQGITLGLSGGIDSALTLAIATDALGAEHVHAVMMPFRYTADISIADAKEEAELLGVEFDIVSIEPMFESFMQQITPLFQHVPESSSKDTTEENLQARCRAVILMALSNKKRRLVLTTSNKSEVAVGYSTLYGDMAGGFNVLKDVPKTLVYELSQYRNTVSYVIPSRVIERAPSAELAPDQTDQDNLPPYEILDPLLKAYVEEDASVESLLATGFSQADIDRVLRLVNFNQYKRSQSPIGPKITQRSFTKDRRYPVTSGFNPFLKTHHKTVY